MLGVCGAATRAANTEGEGNDQPREHSARLDPSHPGEDLRWCRLTV